MKRLLGPAVAVIATLAAAFLLGEWMVRALYQERIVMFPRYHTDYRYGEYRLRGIRPNEHFRHRSLDGSWSFVTNSRGLRDTRDFAYEKPAGTLRVLALGDSHTQGYEVRQEATYAAVLERYLVRARQRAEVLNAGVSGFSTAEALAFLENEGYRYRPDVVVLGFYANDFEDNRRAGLFALDGDRLIAVKRSYLPGVGIQNAIYSLPGVAWLSENSYAYSLAFNGVWASFKTAMRARASQAAPGADLPQFESAVPRKASYPTYDLALAAALIERMRRFCDALNARFIVVDIPRPGARYELVESLPGGLLKNVELVRSRELLDEFDGAVELHLPHGHRHISEFTHALIAVELARRIASP